MHQSRVVKPNPRLLDRLSTARYRLTRSKPSVGVGDRRSNTKGAGMEFAAHRPYREGDDVRHVDPRLLARLGENFIREYFVDRQVPVYVILDASRSMCTGKPDKYGFAALLAQLFGFIALTSGDQVQMAVSGEGSLAWSPRLQGANRADLLFGWLRDRKPGGVTTFSSALQQAAAVMNPAALVILISDFLDGDLFASVAKLGEAGHDLVAIHVASPEEADPSLLGNGAMRMRDAETGEELEVSLGHEMVQRYKSALAAWQEDLQGMFKRCQGYYFFLRSDAEVERFFLRDLRAVGLLA